MNHHDEPVAMRYFDSSMTRHKCKKFSVLAGIRSSLLACLVTLAVAAQADSLMNAYVRADFGSRGLTNLTELASGKSIQFNLDKFYASMGANNF